MAKTVRYSVGPKRRIEKTFTRINHAIQSTETNLTAHTADDRKTLVRIVGDLHFIHDVSTLSVAELLIHIHPAGTAVAAPSITQATDNNMPNVIIYRQTVGMKADGDSISIHVDIKGQRKLAQNDKIVISTKCGTNDDVDVVGTLVFMYKE